ncbi:putative cupin domain protein [Phaeomoniella chlamydospora]|uniref:Putative cupin domain protein n=1 Tax=Phaeomoniella chlamydospora TaxID=158046 RepID=A0A0G2HKN2_PHACM|nr:putative cupin domain protein [Phaeomoniella chlamydospora]
MPPRTAPRRARENDYSNLGKAGRRTGVTIPEGRRDEYGLEEITGIFSSPQKPSPVKRSQNASTVATTGSKSATRSGVPRSASPRKTGISGSARRSEGLDLSPSKQAPLSDERDKTALPTYPTPIPINGNIARRFSPDNSPLGEVTSNRFTPAQNRSMRKSRESIAYRNLTPRDDAITGSAKSGRSVRSARSIGRNNIDPSLIDAEVQEEDDNVIGMNDDDQDEDFMPPDNGVVDEEDQDLDAQLQRDALQNIARSTPQAKGGRKRKSDEFHDTAHVKNGRSASQPNTKKARTTTAKRRKVRDESVDHDADANDSTVAEPRNRGRGFGGRKDPNVPISTTHPKELDDIVERIKARPGKTKSLYILRRETPTDDSATHTRSGRVSVKPLAYWRNERCVYGDSGDVPEGSRFPLSTIKEIIRTDEVDATSKQRGKKGSKGKKKQAPRKEDYDDGEDTDDGADEFAEPWELENGVLQGPVAQWDPELEGTRDTPKEIDLAYSALGIETREVKNATFRYAKLLSTPFFGCGIVDIPPGGEKRPKNRNMYSIQNLLDKPARIFFSQACVTGYELDAVDGDGNVAPADGGGD